MDTTPQYIKMCEKAVEIKIHPKGFSVYATLDDEMEVIAEYADIERQIIDGLDIAVCLLKDGYSDEVICRLHRQDQLQEMAGIKTAEDFDIEFLPEVLMPYEKSVKDCYLNMSMEQLWLAFVMKEKYQKVWNGEDWVKDEK